MNLQKTKRSKPLRQIIRRCDSLIVIAFVVTFGSRPCSVGGHALRRLCGTTLNNVEGVSIEEALGSMRHASVGATRTYIVHDNVSGGKKFAAYSLQSQAKHEEEGVNMKPTMHTITRPKRRRMVQTPYGNHTIV
eukprot:15336028-Ditylum_brightwellii.AAC.1